MPTTGTGARKLRICLDLAEPHLDFPLPADWDELDSHQQFKIVQEYGERAADRLLIVTEEVVESPIPDEPPATYRACLDGERYPVVIAHLLPGETLTVTSPDGGHTLIGDGEFPWIAFHCDDPCPRTARYLTELRLAQNTPLRKRRTVTLALRAIRKGGAAVLEYGQLQTYPERTERGPVAFAVITPHRPAADA